MYIWSILKTKNFINPFSAISFPGTFIRSFLLLVLFCISEVKAQQPAYFSFAEEQFRGIQIYDVIQDKDLNYWFATNEGLFCFDHHTFEKKECDKAKGNSVFNFTINKEGTIYCHNLNNQVFRIRDKECTLFYELKPDESSSDIRLSIADDDNLLISSRKIIVLDKTGKVLLVYAPSAHYIGPPFVTKKNGVQFHLNNVDSVVVYEKGTISKIKLTFRSGGLQNENVLHFYMLDEKAYALTLKTKEHFSYDPTSHELILLPKNSVFERGDSRRIYELGKDVWVAGTLPGVALIEGQKHKADFSIYYEDYFISDVFRDNEGNTLLSTFDKGILVIPDTKVPGVVSSFMDDPATALYSDPAIGLMIGTSKGNLLNYINNSFITTGDKGTRPVEALYGDKNSDWILFDNGYIRTWNKRSHHIKNILSASLKDAVVVTDKQFYLGTNRGIFEVTQEAGNEFSTRLLNGMNQRVYSLEYNPADSSLYASTANGLFMVSPSGYVQQILKDGKPIFPNDMSFHGKLYASTKKQGVLVIEKEKVTAAIYPVVNDEIEALKKIIIHNNTIIGESSNGLFQFDMQGKHLRSIHSTFGFSAKRIIDFTFHQNRLWVSHSGGVQAIDLNYTKTNAQRPLIRIDQILVNDGIIATAEKAVLKSNQRKIQFIFSSPTLKNRETLRYHYKLEGNDAHWNTGNYESFQVTYSALAPGDYTFYVKAENQGVFSEPLKWSFTITPPFYESWWFITASVLLFLGIVFIVYNRQLSAQRKKSQQINELNASKLTAIQSQMNPHFIFNSLNSIQDLILKGDVEHSYSYITTFSNLVRRTLSYSEKDFIDFEQEIKLLELYLTLEKLRFKKELNYSIDMTNVTDIILPPLLIQPFIENSLLHGLLHKEGSKQLKITFELKEALVCTIEDNGIGRERSKAIKLRQRSEHESFSGKAIRKRFDILSNVFKGDFGYTYEDLYKNNEAVGTKVILVIPVKRKF